MSQKIGIDELAKTLAEGIANYTLEVAEGVKEAADLTAKELLESTRADAPKRKGRYRRAIAIKTTRENDFQKVNVWYVKKPYYRLAHLLEKGHIKRNGGRTRAFPHIERNAETAIENFNKRVEEVIKNGGK